MKAIINGTIIDKFTQANDAALIFDDRVRGISYSTEGCELIDARGGYVVPGLIDLHIHGFDGSDISDGTVEAVRTVSEGIVKNGVTSYLPTTMTMPYDDITRAFDSVRDYLKGDTSAGARVLGVNMEGPYLSPSKRGAHEISYLKIPNADFVIANNDIVRLTTIAPELPGAMECIPALVRNGIRVSIGHTAADYETALRAIELGANQATHTFNAMPAINHRDPGALTAVITDDRVYCELIADTFHVNKAFFKFLVKLKGDRLMLITDCTRAGGMGDGVYTLGGQEMHVSGIKCLLPDGTIAGSILTLNKAVKNMYMYGGVSLNNVVAMATYTPACALGLEHSKGAFMAGMDADIAIFDRDFNTLRTIIGGETVYAADR